jgi:hypothetical protein
VKKNNHPVEGPDGLACTARLPLSSATLNWLADLIRGVGGGQMIYGPPIE